MKNTRSIYPITMNIYIENRLVVIGGDGKTERLSSTELITEEEKNLNCNINPLSDNLFNWFENNDMLIF